MAFPTLFHYLTGEDTLAELFQGESIFKANRNPFVVVARYNASRAPFEFFIHNGKYKLMARFADEKEIFKSKELHILSTKDIQDNTVSHTPELLQQHFGPAIQKLFQEQ